MKLYIFYILLASSIYALCPFFLGDISVSLFNLSKQIGGLHWVLVAGYKLSCPIAYGISVPRPGTEPESPALESRFLTSGTRGKSLLNLFLSWKVQIVRKYKEKKKSLKVLERFFSKYQGLWLILRAWCVGSGMKPWGLYFKQSVQMLLILSLSQKTMIFSTLR